RRKGHKDYFTLRRATLPRALFSRSRASPRNKTSTPAALPTVRIISPLSGNDASEPPSIRRETSTVPSGRFHSTHDCSRALISSALLSAPEVPDSATASAGAGVTAGALEDGASGASA